MSPIYATAERVIERNLAERKRKSPTALAYPKWWEEFLIIGTDGAGGDYALSLNQNHHVYLIGDEYGAEATREFKSLRHFVDHLIDVHNPPRLPSCFDDSRPLMERCSFIVWGTQCRIESLPGDRPLTIE